jgi:hypothetical protein
MITEVRSITRTPDSGPGPAGLRVSLIVTPA